MSQHHKFIDYVRSLFFIAVTFGIALGASDGVFSYLNVPAPILIMIASFIIHWLAFVPSFFYRTEKYYDFIGMIAYLSCVALSLILIYQSKGIIHMRTLIVSSMVVIWTVRLGTFLFKRIKLEKEDKRFKDLKNSFSGFLFAWTISGAWVFITASNAFTMTINNYNSIKDVYFYLGTILWIFGFLFEVISDEQKRRFKLDKNNKGKFISTGLWSISRHPNYFGEIVLWFGISVISFPTLNSWQFITLISPVFVFLLLTKVSGVNHLEKRSDQEWGQDPSYVQYKTSTPVLFPYIGSK